MGLQGKKALRSDKECATLNLPADGTLAGAKIGNLDPPIWPRVLDKNVLVVTVRRSAAQRVRSFI